MLTVLQAVEIHRPRASFPASRPKNLFSAKRKDSGLDGSFGTVQVLKTDHCIAPFPSDKARHVHMGKSHIGAKQSETWPRVQ